VSYAAAAIFTLAAASTLYFVIFNTRDEQFHTAFGETRRISLSDGSNVVLNDNSTLTLNDMDPSAGSRSVTLDGTAWFEVIHPPDNRPFIVRTDGEVYVHVLGTTFEVGQKNGIVEVFLKSGKVKVVSGDHESVMRPGQIAVASRVGITLAESSVDAVNARLSWVAGQYVMNESTLEQVAAHILEHFGKRVAIDDPALLSTTVSGKVPANDLPVLLEVLKQTLHLRIRETDGTLYIRRDIGADVK
jgi:ferric-dicitrate binding protein FerR (iron transport regulator)